VFKCDVIVPNLTEFERHLTKWQASHVSEQVPEVVDDTAVSPGLIEIDE